MKEQLYIRRSCLPVSAEAAFAWHARPGALRRLIPPWSGIRLIVRSGGIEPGARTVLRMPLGPLRLRWEAEHQECEPGRRFRDVQARGPFRLWDHEHCFEPCTAASCLLEDKIRYVIPLGALGRLLAGRAIAADLDRTFVYRHRTTSEDLALHARYLPRPLTVAVSGASGLVGSALCALLTTGGHRVLRLVRSTHAEEDEIRWDPRAGVVDGEKLGGVDAVVHLAGEGIASGRWSAARKARILESRETGTRVLCDVLARMTTPPKVLVSASAIGIYGSRGYERLTEASPQGGGFLAEVCRRWEEATAAASAAGIRVVRLRTGLVLSAAGGALARMLPAFRLGVGGPIGTGRQYVSWISLDDLLGIILLALDLDAIIGPLNAVAPQPVTNRELTIALARALGRPAATPLPRAIVRTVFGEMGVETLLASTRVLPSKAMAAGYVFRDSDVETALRHTLGRFESVADDAS